MLTECGWCRERRECAALWFGFGEPGDMGGALLTILTCSGCMGTRTLADLRATWDAPTEAEAARLEAEARRGGK